MGAYDQAILDLRKKVDDAEKDVREWKNLVNKLCEMAGSPLIYAVEKESAAANGGPLRPDQYYGKPLATVITMILHARDLQGIGPATTRDIYEQMSKGGYKFETKNDENILKMLRTNMGKNPKFHKLPSKEGQEGTWGLTEWYPAVRESKQPPKDGDKPAIEEEPPITERPNRGPGRPKKVQESVGDTASNNS